MSTSGDKRSAATLAANTPPAGSTCHRKATPSRRRKGLLFTALLAAMALSGSKGYAQCYDAANVGKIGTAAPCDGMLIVNRAMLDSVMNSKNSVDFVITKNGVDYTFGNSTGGASKNIFTGQVTDMSELFKGKTLFNADINYWEVDSVTNMRLMFQNAEAFNQPLNEWNVGKVTDMVSMFRGAENFNQSLNDWDVSKVTNMQLMFNGAIKFNDSLNNWNVGSVTKMRQMFERASEFNKPLSNWDVRSVKDMSNMFKDAKKFNQSLNDWKVDSVKDMNSMFNGAIKFNDSLNNWNVSNVTNMAGMFYEASEFNKPLSNWDVRSVKDMSGMFNRASKFNQPLNNWNVGNVTNMSEMFNGATNFKQPLDDWNVSKVTRMNSMFNDAEAFNQPLNNWNVSNVTNMAGMFNDAEAFNQPLNNWNVSKVTSMNGMFYSAGVFNQPLNDWNVSKVTNMGFMFDGATAFNQNLACWDVASITTEPNNFANSSVLSIPNQPRWGKKQPDLSISVVDSTATLVNADATIDSTYQWLNCSDSSIITDSIYSTYTDSTAGTYAVRVVGKSGCIDTSACVALPCPAARTETRRDTACGTYTWIDGITYDASTNTPTYTFASTNGCDSLIVTLELTIKQLPDVIVSVTNGSIATLTNADANSDSTYRWLDCSDSSAIASSDDSTYTASTAGDYAVEVVGKNGCVDTSICVPLTAGTTCTPTQLTDSIVTCGSHTWKNGITYTADTTNVTYKATGGGSDCDTIYTLKLTITDTIRVTETVTTCGSYTWPRNNMTYTSSTSTPTDTVSGSGSTCDTVYTLNLTISPLATTTTVDGATITVANNQGASYKWLDCDNNKAAISGETGLTFAPEENGNYAVAIASGTCQDTSSCVAITTVGLLENNFAHALRVYPNPTEGDITIDLGTQHATVALTLTDASGKQVGSATYTNAQKVAYTILQPAGVYFMTLTAADQRAVIRLVKE